MVFILWHIQLSLSMTPSRSFLKLYTACSGYKRARGTIENLVDTGGRICPESPFVSAIRNVEKLLPALVVDARLVVRLSSHPTQYWPRPSTGWCIKIYRYRMEGLDLRNESFKVCLEVERNLSLIINLETRIINENKCRFVFALKSSYSRFSTPDFWTDERHKKLGDGEKKNSGQILKH